MGHKVHPYGFRLGVSRTWTAKWYADKEYTTLLKEDIAIRQLVERRLANASVSQVEIERGINHVTVTVHTAKPGIVIGKGGQNVEILRQQIGALTKRKVKLEIKEIRQPELDAYLVAMNIAQQLSPPDRLPQGDEAGHPADDEGRRQGRQDHGLGPPRRLRDGPPRVGQGRPDPARARSAPTSATARSTPTRPTAGSASRSGSTAATSSPSGRPPATPAAPAAAAAGAV